MTVRRNIQVFCCTHISRKGCYPLSEIDCGTDKVDPAVQKYNATNLCKQKIIYKNNVQKQADARTIYQHPATTMGDDQT
jgi:hypothetical protein